MSSVGAFRALSWCVILTGVCVGQVTKPAVAAKTDARPAIIQRGPQAVQIVSSPGTADAQLSNAGFHLASGEEIDAMEQTLEQYVLAFESLSLPQVKQVWPELDTKHTKAFKEVFEAFKGAPAPPRLTLQCAIPKVTADLANVQCLETVTYSVGKGKTKDAGPAKVEIQLKGQSSHWVLQDMKGKA
jgi:hypothetical protein